MSDFKKRYKKPPTTFGNANKLRNDLIYEQRARRRKRRTQDFEENRPESRNDVFRTKLLDWKAERSRKKEAQGSQKKPPFVVGIVHHQFYSPVSRTANNILGALTERKKTAQKNSNIKKRVTKVTEKRLLAKAANVETTSVNKKSTEIVSNDKVESTNVNKRESFAPPNHKFNPPAGLSKIPLFGKETSTLERSDEQKETLDSSRRKQTNSMVSSSSDLTDKLAIKGAIMENPAVPMEEKYTVEYFEGALNKERNRLRKLCEEWTEIQLQGNIAEDIRYQINQAVGQTTMLITKKFKKFNDLILLCEGNNDGTLVTCMDLHGFWDMMYIEVRDCDSRFAKLEKLRARCWKEDQSSAAISASPKEKVVIKKKVTPAGRKSSLRASSILSDKRKKVVEIQGNEKNPPDTVNVNNDECITPYITNKRASVFKGGSNVTQSKRFLEISTNYMYTSTPIPNNATSKVSNQLSTPLIAMKVSQLYDKSMLLNDTTLQVTPERTLRLSSVEKSERSRSNSLRMKLIRKAGLNDYLIMTKSSERGLHIDRNSGTSSKKINGSDDSNGRIHVEGKSSSGTDSSDQTVIEKTICEKNNTFRLSSPSIDSVKIPAEDKRSDKGSSSNKSLKMKSFGRSPRHSVVNKIKSPVCVPDAVNISPIPRKASLIHDGNIRSQTPSNTDQVIKKRNSSVKRACNKTVISNGTPKVNGRIKMIFSHKKNIN